MADQPFQIRNRIVHYCKRMDEKGWVSNHDGNISVQSTPQTGRWLCTPSARSKADLAESDLIEVDHGGKTLNGEGRVFSEWSIHHQIYLLRKDVRAVVHSHSPHATAVGCAGHEMITWAVPEAVVSLGPGVPLASLAVPGSEDFNREMGMLIPSYDAVMVGGNGVFAWGSTLEQAFLRMELVEHLATIFLHSVSLGGPKLLDQKQVANLMQKREKAGLALPIDHARPTWFLK